jgi:uncharacterized protein YndB with AHSA1/START domain
MDLHFERRYNAPRERVWWALTDPDALERWYMKANGLTPNVGCKFTLHDADAKGWSGWLNCEVLVCDQPSVLKYRSTERKSLPHSLNRASYDLTLELLSELMFSTRRPT